MECSENIRTLQFPLVKGELSLREVKFLKGVRSEAGWAITRVLGPSSQATWGRGKLCGGDSRRDADGSAQVVMGAGRERRGHTGKKPGASTALASPCDPGPPFQPP